MSFNDRKHCGLLALTGSASGHITDLENLLLKSNVATPPEQLNDMWHTYWDDEAVPKGHFNDRAQTWLNMIGYGRGTLSESWYAFWTAACDGEIGLSLKALIGWTGTEGCVAVDYLTVTVKFSKSVTFTEATLPNGVIITHNNGGVFTITASSGSGTTLVEYTGTWDIDPVAGDIVDWEYDGTGDYTDGTLSVIEAKQSYSVADRLLDGYIENTDNPWVDASGEFVIENGAVSYSNLSIFQIASLAFNSLPDKYEITFRNLSLGQNLNGIGIRYTNNNNLIRCYVRNISNTHGELFIQSRNAGSDIHDETLSVLIDLSQPQVLVIEDNVDSIKMYWKTFPDQFVELSGVVLTDQIGSIAYLGAPPLDLEILEAVISIRSFEPMNPHTLDLINCDGDRLIPLARTAIVLGDSRTSVNQYEDNTSFYSTSSRGWWCYCNAALAGEFTLLDIAATPGDHIVDGIPRMPGILEKNPDVLFIMLDINTIHAFTSEDDFPIAWSDYKNDLVDPAIAKGIMCVLMTPTASTSLFTQIQIDGWYYMNQQMIDYAAENPNVLVADLGRETYGTPGELHTPLDGFTNDGLHPDVTGAELIGLSASNAIINNSGLITPPLSIPGGGNNSASLSGMPFNIANNAGVLTGTPLPTGNAPTGFSLQGGCTNGTGVTISGQMILADDGGADWCEVALTGAGMAGQTSLIYSLLGALLPMDKFAVDDWIEMGFEYEIVSATELMSIQAIVHMSGATYSFNYHPRAFNGSQNRAELDGDKFMRSIPFKIQPSTNSMRLYIECRHQGSVADASSIVRFRNPYIIKLDDFSDDNSIIQL